MPLCLKQCPSVWSSPPSTSPPAPAICTPIDPEGPTEYLTLSGKPAEIAPLLLTSSHAGLYNSLCLWAFLIRLWFIHLWQGLCLINHFIPRMQQRTLDSERSADICWKTIHHQNNFGCTNEEASPPFFTSSKEIDTKTASFKGVYKQKKVLQDFSGTPAWKENVTEDPASFLLLSPSSSLLSVCAPPSCSPSLPLKPSSM